MVLEMLCDRPRGVAKLSERQCAGTRGVSLVKYTQRPYQQRHVRSPSTTASHRANPLSMSWMMRMRMSFLSSYQHLGTQSQRAYHDDGLHSRGSASSNANITLFALQHAMSYLSSSSSNNDDADDAASFMRRCVSSDVG
jgi:hypothetical protein